MSWVEDEHDNQIHDDFMREKELKEKKNKIKLPFSTTNPYQKIIVKYAKQKAKHGQFNWEKLGEEIYSLISKNQEGINKYGTQAERNKYDKVMTDGEEVLNFFFSESSFGAPIYDWVNGNSDFKRLVEQLKQK